MKKCAASGFVRPRLLLALTLCAAGTALAIAPFFTPLRATKATGPTLRLEKTQLVPRPVSPTSARERRIDLVAPPPSGITFGHPVISGIGGTGFEQAIRIDPTNPNRIYTSTPGTASADTSWIWRSLDAGKTFKWVPGSAPYEGKVTICHGGGDTELAVDEQGRLYFNDLTLLNFSTARSDDFGATFNCTNTAVPDVVVDRQWYAVDGDPLNGGTLYLTNDEVGQGPPVCGTTPANNVLVIYRSPFPGTVPGMEGIQFGPPNRITGEDGCNEGITGNIEVSPVATTLGQPIAGGFATLSTPVKHVYVVHDDANLHQVLMARCYPVPFIGIDPNEFDPSGLKCTDRVVANLGAAERTGGDFPTMAIDNAGNLYTVWEQSTITGTTMTGGAILNGEVVLKFSSSTDQGNTWSTPVQIDTSGSPLGTLHQNVFAWINAGDDGRVNITWYGTDGTAPTGQRGPDDCNDCIWYLWMTQSLNAHDAAPVFTAPILASEHHVHKGNVQSLIGGQNQLSSRSFGDFLQMRVGPKGEANITYADSNRALGTAISHGMYVRQNSGLGLYAATSPVALPNLAPFNFVNDPRGDGKYEAGGLTSNNMPQLDILRSSVVKVTTAPCSVLAPCYRFSMVINNLSLTPTPVDAMNSYYDPDPDLVWLTQWFVPSPADGDGGKNYHVYAEAYSDGTNPPTLQCFLGESANLLVSGGATITYPGDITALPAANCQMTPGPNGVINIYVPIASVTVAGAIDNRLHEVTASTMTLPQPANSNPNLAGLGGLTFNLIDVAQGYVFDPTVVRAVSQKTHDIAGTFDIELPLTGTPGVECRMNTAADTGANAGRDHRVVVSLPYPALGVASTTVTSTSGATANTTVNADILTIDLHSVADKQRLTINLMGVNSGNSTADFTIPMDVLEADTDGDTRVNIVDTNQTKRNSGQLTNSDNARTDVNLDARINVADTNFVKKHAGNCIGVGCQ